jgi:hypothetical protein
MNEDAVTAYITNTFAGIDTVVSSGSTFFFYNPISDLPPDHNFPIVTLVTSDIYDQFSNLDRPEVYRLNIGVSKATFQSLFGAQQKGDDVGKGYDFTALDQVMPHPVYGRMHWVCVLNPSVATFKTVVQPLLAEAYEMAVSNKARRTARG